MRDYLFEKTVDKSLLKDGFTIPVDMHEIIQDCLGIRLLPGEKSTIKIKVDDQAFEAVVYNLNFDEKYPRTVFQIRYSNKYPILAYLKKVFRYTNSRLTNIDDSSKINEEKIRIYRIDDHMLEFECLPNKEDMLTNFYAYIGKPNSLQGYERSYKLVFYKCFLRCSHQKKQLKLLV